jgi:hypothetical protein
MNSLDQHRRTHHFGSSFVPRGHGRILALVAALLGGACGPVAFAQTTPVVEQPVVITVEGDNSVLYRGDTFDISKIAKNPTPTTSTNQAFIASINVGDVRTVNGQPAKGLWSYHTTLAMPFRASPQPGQPIADMDSGGFIQCVWHILSPDGRYVGTLIDSGASPSPDHIVIGGSGAFQGMTGVHGMMQWLTAPRGASTSEDPANRRINGGGGKFRIVFYLYPRSRPNVVLTANGPAVTHGDGKLVSTANPAQAGEILTLYASGLGPTTPAVDFGQPFPQTATLSKVNSPVEVRVNGQSAEVLYAGGYPGAVDAYQVNFRVPSGITSGTAALYLTSAWIPGSEVRIAIR